MKYTVGAICLIAIATIGINAGFSYKRQKQEWEFVVKALKRNARETHKRLLAVGGYRNADCATRVEWCKKLQDPLMQEILDEFLDSERHQELIDYVHELLPSICATN